MLSPKTTDDDKISVAAAAQRKAFSKRVMAAGVGLALLVGLSSPTEGTFLFLAGMCFYSTVRMPKHPLFRIQTIGLAGFGVVLGLIGLILFIPAVRERVQDIYWFSMKVAAFMYLYIWYRGTFPRYRFDQLMKVGWKILLPMGLGVLILTAGVGLWPLIQQTIWNR